jgi:hypothetical protein
MCTVFIYSWRDVFCTFLHVYCTFCPFQHWKVISNDIQYAVKKIQTENLNVKHFMTILAHLLVWWNYTPYI